MHARTHAFLPTDALNKRHINCATAPSCTQTNTHTHTCIDNARSCVFSDTYSAIRRLSGESVCEDRAIVRRSLKGFVDYFGLCRKSFRKALTPPSLLSHSLHPLNTLQSFKKRRSPVRVVHARAGLESSTLGS